MARYCVIAPDTSVFIERLKGLENTDTWLLHNLDIEKGVEAYEKVLRWLKDTRPDCAIFDLNHLCPGGDFPNHVKISWEMSEQRTAALFFQHHDHKNEVEYALCELMSDLFDMSHEAVEGQELLDLIQDYVKEYKNYQPSPKDLGLLK